MEIQTLKTGQLATNCYLVYDQKAPDIIVIDPGDDADYIISQLNESNKIPSKIIATHGHFDHLLAVTELKLAYNIPLLMHKDDAFLLNRLQSSAKYFIGIEADPPPSVDQFLKDGDKISVGDYSLDIIATPGHTPGGIALYCKEEKALFVGDTIFEEGGVGRTDFTYSKHNDLIKSIEKLLKLPEDTVVYPGHGEITSVKEAKQHFR